MHAGTIVSHHYLAHARTVGRSFLRHNPDARFTAVVVGDTSAIGANEPFEVITEHELGMEDIASRRRRYDDFEYAVSFKPTFLRYLLERDSLAVYLDADLYVVGDFAGLGDRFGEGDVVLTPHLIRSLPDDGLEPSMPSILRAGVFNTGFVGARRAPTTSTFLDWWEARLVTGCKIDVGRGYFVDQRWMDLVPILLPGVTVLRELAWNLGHWNLAGAELEKSPGGWSIDGEPLRAFHFSGFNPDKPGRLSKHQNRIVVEPGSPLAELCAEYAGAMKDGGYDAVAGGGKNTYYGRDLPHRLLPLMRRAALLRAKLSRR